FKILVRSDCAYRAICECCVSRTRSRVLLAKISMRGDSLEHRYCTHKGLARVSNSRGTRETVPYAMVESEKSAEVLRLALGRCASSRFAQDDIRKECRGPATRARSLRFLAIRSG